MYINDYWSPKKFYYTNYSLPILIEVEERIVQDFIFNEELSIGNSKVFVKIIMARFIFQNTSIIGKQQSISGSGRWIISWICRENNIRETIYIKIAYSQFFREVLGVEWENSWVGDVLGGNWEDRTIFLVNLGRGPDILGKRISKRSIEATGYIRISSNIIINNVNIHRKAGVWREIGINHINSSIFV